ncbi:MAG: fused response regulator/phosphatase [Nitrospinae bacterium]|nr:fused response regulator/phosphatase [Nitrospinota bacterium]
MHLKSKKSANSITERPTILVVDDSQVVVRLIREILKRDFDVLAAGNGLEAVQAFREKKPDMVLLDVEMPVMDGYEACRRIKGMRGAAFTPIIFITGKSDLKSIKEGLDSGAEDYLTKPFQPEELLARVNAGLRTRRLYNQLAEANAQIERERDIIANIQRSLLSQSPPDIPGFRFFSDYQPSSKAGGDYYDFIRIDDERLGALVADVSGHGTPAAVIMAMMRIVLRSHLSKVQSPREVLERLNAILCENVKTGDFITAFYGVIHLPTRRMTYASAGHHPCYLFDCNTGEVLDLWVDKGFPLMIRPENPIGEAEVCLPLNSKLVLYTDGITEARDPRGEFFGVPRFLETIKEQGRTLDAQKLGKRLMEVVGDFTRGAGFIDDYTLVIVDVE